MQTKLFVADDQLNLYQALSLWLEMLSDYAIVGTATDANHLVEGVATTQPDVLLLDWELHGLGSEAAKSELVHTLCTSYPHLRIIALSSKLNPRKNALPTGVAAIVSKSESPDQLLAVLQQNHLML